MLDILNKWWNVLHKKSGLPGAVLMTSGGEISGITQMTFTNSTPTTAYVSYQKDKRIIHSSYPLIGSGKNYTVTIQNLRTDPETAVYIVFGGEKLTLRGTNFNSLDFIDEFTKLTDLELVLVQIQQLLSIRGLVNISNIRLTVVSFPNEQVAIDFANSVPENTNGTIRLLSVDYANIIKPILENKGWKVS